MSAPLLCATCEQPTFEGVCPRCAFSSALAAASAGPWTDGDTAPRLAKLEPPEGYDLLYELGAGATAVVWLARERKLDRLVALKLISVAGDWRLIQRLTREGHAAATLRHRNIVAVHAMDATPTHAYLAMDFVDGGDLRKHLAQALPAPRRCAEIVRKLADGLAHAHANGVLHRDIKPSNVLLDTDGEPHLADFGLATSIGGGGDLTLPGQVVGTAAYLAPELLNGNDHASPASDLYSLGALLYACLTGRPPFVGDTATSIFAQVAECDPVPPHLLRAHVDRDLETICLKCLEKLPGRRYSSAEALRDDLDRFMRGEPIAARPVSFAGKTVRWCRRHPSTAAFAGISALLLLSLAIGGPTVALRLARAQAIAAEEAAASKAVSDFLQNDLLAEAAPDHQAERDLKLRTVLDRAAKNIEGRFAQQPLIEADVRDTLAATYMSLGELAASQQHWSRARKLRAQALGPEHPKTLRTAANLIDLLRQQGRITVAEPLGVELLKKQRRVLGPEHPDTLSSLNNLGLILVRTAKLAEAEAVFTEAVTLRRRVSGPEHPDTLAAIHNLATVYASRGKNELALRLYHNLRELAQRSFGQDHPKTLIAMNNLANTHLKLGNFAEAEKLCAETLERRQRVLGPEHPDTLITLTTLTRTYVTADKLGDAETLCRQILEIQKRKLGEKHPDVFVSMNNLACVYRDQGRLAEAERLHEETLEKLKRVLGPHHRFTLNSMGKLAGVFYDQGRWEEAAALGAETVALCERGLEPTHAYTIQARRFLGRALLRQGRCVEAEPLLRMVVERRPEKLNNTWQAALDSSQLGQVLLALGRQEEAEPLLLASHDILKKNARVIPPADSRVIRDTADAIARLYRERGDTAKAEVWRHQVIATNAGR
jgi:eukaryotic-like serine/threonine-protein kinase